MSITIKNIPKTFKRVVPRPFQHVDAITALCWTDDGALISADRSGLILKWSRTNDGGYRSGVVIRQSGSPSCDTMLYWRGALWCLGQGKVWGICLVRGETLALDGLTSPVLNLLQRHGTLVAHCAGRFVVWRWDEQQQTWANRFQLENAHYYHEDPISLDLSPCGQRLLMNRYNQYARRHVHEVYFWDFYDDVLPTNWHWRRAGRWQVCFGDTANTIWMLNQQTPQMLATDATGLPVEDQVLSLPYVCDQLITDTQSQTALLWSDAQTAQGLHVNLSTFTIDNVSFNTPQRSTCLTLETHLAAGTTDGYLMIHSPSVGQIVLGQSYQSGQMNVQKVAQIDGPTHCFETQSTLWFLSEQGLWRWSRQTAQLTWVCSILPHISDTIVGCCVLGDVLMLQTAQEEQYLIKWPTDDLFGHFAWPIERFVEADGRLWGMMPCGQGRHMLCVADLEQGLLTTIKPPPGVHEDAWLSSLTTCNRSLILHALIDGKGQSWLYTPEHQHWLPFTHREASTLSPHQRGYWPGRTDAEGRCVLWLDDRRTGWVVRDCKTPQLDVVGRMYGPDPSRYNQQPHIESLTLSTTSGLVMGLIEQVLHVWNMQGVCLGYCPDVFEPGTQFFFEANGDRFLAHHPQQGVMMCGLVMC